MTSPDAPGMIERLARFVAINTENPPGQEAPGAEFLAAELRGLGLEVEIREELPRRANVIGRLDNGPGPRFAFNSHIDVVPAGSGWSHSAFDLIEKNDRLYGRGACDAKGPVVAMIEAARMLVAMRNKWSGQLLLVFVFDEEVQSLGAKEYAKQGAKIDYAIIGEPTSNIVATAHKGSIRPIIRVHGVAAHSGTPHLGINAIVRAAQLIGLFDEHHHERLCRQHHALVGSPSLTVTRVMAGTGDTVVPESCDLMVDRRLVPGDDRDAAIKELEDILALAKERFGVRAEIIEFRPTTGPATETPLDHPIVRTTESIAASFNGNAKPVGFPAGCDLVHFRSLGAAGVVLGPGDLGVAHKPDEFIPVKEFIDASVIYRDTVLKMLRDGGAMR